MEVVDEAEVEASVGVGLPAEEVAVFVSELEVVGEVQEVECGEAFFLCAFFQDLAADGFCDAAFDEAVVDLLHEVCDRVEGQAADGLPVCGNFDAFGLRPFENGQRLVDMHRVIHVGPAGECVITKCCFSQIFDLDHGGPPFCLRRGGSFSPLPYVYRKAPASKREERGS